MTIIFSRIKAIRWAWAAISLIAAVGAGNARAADTLRIKNCFFDRIREIRRVMEA